ncbi:hypothetical protein AVEN_193631-1 [Araneus ventricosus]|uniref:Uncharacterized protein n=1 Tax=Araneus ventricosus TaxID=182803 RepID=A0A4Y2HEY4_ARAVE|nr:hypothetical protein AVEN_193631-1 [Araneus ventricosus]
MKEVLQYEVLRPSFHAPYGSPLNNYHVPMGVFIADLHATSFRHPGPGPKNTVILPSVLWHLPFFRAKKPLSVLSTQVPGFMKSSLVAQKPKLCQLYDGH